MPNHHDTQRVHHIPKMKFQVANDSNTFTCLDELKVGLDDYTRYYSADRIKLKLGCLSPADYRMQFLSQ